MESTEKCEVVIQHFNGKYLKTPPGIPGESPLLFALHYSRITLPFLSRKIITFEMRNFLSNSIMVISHLRSAGQLDRLCTPLFLTPEASCRGYGWIADGSIGRFLSLSLSLCLSVTISFPSLVVLLLLQAQTSRAGENPLNIHTHASVLFFAIYLRACTLPSFFSCSCSLLPCPLSFLWLSSAVTLDSGTSWPRRKQSGKRGWKKECHKMETDVETRLYRTVC